MPNYTYPGTDIVKNKLDAKTLDELEKREARFVAQRVYQLEIGEGPRGNFDADHLKAIHRHLFQDVFEWAGHTRDERVKLSDGTIASEPMMRKSSGRFLLGPKIPAALACVAGEIRAANFLRDLSSDDFAVRAANVLADINGIHAFREGNGRTQRAFVSELARAAGHDLDFSPITRERMIQASIAANEGNDRGMMQRLFADAIMPERRAALMKAIAALESFGVGWNDQYIATAEPGHPIELVLVGTAGEQFMGRAPDSIIVGRTADLPEPTPARGETFVLFGQSAVAKDGGDGDDADPDKPTPRHRRGQRL